MEVCIVFRYSRLYICIHIDILYYFVGGVLLPLCLRPRKVVDALMGMCAVSYDVRRDDD